MKPTTKIAVFVAAVLAVIGVIVVLNRRKRQETELDNVGNVLGCVSVPKTFTSWSGAFAATDWDKLKKAMRDHLDADPEDLDLRSLVEGFFKAIDVEPKGAYVRYFQKDLKVWLKSAQALPHWEVAQGSLNCK